MRTITDRILAATVATGLVTLPACRNRSSSSMTLEEQQTQLTQLQNESKAKIMEFFSDQSNSAWTFKVRDSYGNYMPIALEELLSGLTPDYQQFILLPPPSDKSDIAIQIMPMGQDLESGIIKAGLTISSRDLKKPKGRDTITINALSEDPKGEVVKIQESIRALQVQVDGKKTGRVDVPKAHASDTPLETYLAIGCLTSFAVFAITTVTILTSLGPPLPGLPPATRFQKNFLVLLFLGSLAVLFATSIVWAAKYDRSPLDHIIDRFRLPASGNPG